MTGATAPPWIGTGVGGRDVFVVVVVGDVVAEWLETACGDLLSRTECAPDEPVSTNPHATTTATKTTAARQLRIRRSRRFAACRRIRRAMFHAHSRRGVQRGCYADKHVYIQTNTADSLRTTRWPTNGSVLAIDHSAFDRVHSTTPWRVS